MEDIVNFREFLGVKNMKNTLRNAALITAFVFGAAGIGACSDTSSKKLEGGAQSGIVQVEGTTAEAAAETVEAFFKAGSKFTWEDYDKFEEAMEFSGMDTSVAATPLDHFETLSKDQMKEAASMFQKANLGADYIDYSGMSEAEQATLNLFMVYMNTAGSEDIMGVPIQISYPVSGIEMDGNKALARLSYLDLTAVSEDGQSGEQSGQEEHIPMGMGENDNLYLKVVDGGWKIDGRETLDAIMNLFNQGDEDVEVIEEEFVQSDS